MFQLAILFQTVADIFEVKTFRLVAHRESIGLLRYMYSSAHCFLLTRLKWIGLQDVLRLFLYTLPRYCFQKSNHTISQVTVIKFLTF